MRDDGPMLRTTWPARDAVVELDLDDLALVILREIAAGPAEEANLQNLQARVLGEWVTVPSYRGAYTLAELEGLDPQAAEALAEAWQVMLARRYARPGVRQPEFVEVTREGRKGLSCRSELRSCLRSRRWRGCCTRGSTAPVAHFATGTSSRPS